MLVVLFALIAAAVAAPADPAILTQQLVDEVNGNPHATWTASLNNQFAKFTVSSAKKLLGAKTAAPAPGEQVVNVVGVTIPDSFDARVQWPNGEIHPIRDQQGCGSCWAFATTNCFDDRLAIKSNNAINVITSPQELVSCEKSSFGCNGGYPIKAWQYVVSNGLHLDQCYPYTSGNGVTGTCKLTRKVSTCAKLGGSGAFTVYKATSAYYVAANVAAIQTEIMTNGPVEIAFDVYNDFFSYTSGVYSHVTGAYAGGHAVKMLGWGNLNGVDYWIAANQWGTGWGMSGYFLIKRGTNECGVESGVTAGTV